MEREKQQFVLDTTLIVKKCDKCCATCGKVVNRGDWLQCSLDNKEVDPNQYCHSYYG